MPMENLTLFRIEYQFYVYVAVSRLAIAHQCFYVNKVLTKEEVLKTTKIICKNIIVFKDKHFIHNKTENNCLG